MHTLRTSLILFLLLATIAIAQPPAPLSNHLWQDPAFIERFSHSYLPHPTLEPTVSTQEQALFARVAPLIASQPHNALQQLEASRSASASAAVDYIAGNLHLQQENLAAARQAYQAAIRKFPSFLRAHRNLGLLEIQADNPQAALQHLRQALELGGASGETYGLIGYAHLHTQQPAAAAAAYQQALIFQPDSRDWRTGLVQSLLQTRTYPQAEAVLDELIAQYPNDPLLWQFHASLSLQQDRPTAAITSLEIARRLAPLSPQSELLLGDLYWQTDMPAAAVTHWQTALSDLTTASPQRIVRILSTLASSSQWDAFEQLHASLSSAVLQSLSPAQSAEVSFFQASHAHQLGHSQQALTLLEANLTTYPLHGKSLLLLGRIHMDNGDLVQAELAYDRAARQSDSRHSALLLQARLEVIQHNPSTAIRLLEQAQQLDYRQDVADYIDALRNQTSRQQR